MSDNDSARQGAGRRYWSAVGAYVVVLLLVQSIMGLGIDKFKELWGLGALEVVAYAIVGVGAVGVIATGVWLWRFCSAAERLWIIAALLIYGFGTLEARSPQERLHYLGYGILAVVLYIGFARDHGAAPTGGAPRGGAGAVLAPALYALLVGSAIGLLDELLQIPWPRRYFDWADVGINVVSVGLGLLVVIPAWNALQKKGG